MTSIGTRIRTLAQRWGKTVLQCRHFEYLDTASRDMPNLTTQREGRRSLMFRHEKAIPSRTVGCCGRLERRPWSLQSMFFRCSIHPRRRPCCRPQAQESRVYIRLHSLGFDLQCLGGISPPSSPLCLPAFRVLALFLGTSWARNREIIHLSLKNS